MPKKKEIDIFGFKMGEDSKGQYTEFNGKWLVGLILVLFLVMLLLSSFYIVRAGERGVLLTFGNPSMDAKEEGLGFKIPLAQKVVKMEVRTLKYETDATSASKDLQDVSTKIAVNYHLSPDLVPEIYRDLSLGYRDRVIQPAVQEVVKASTAEFTAEELITKRPIVKNRIEQLLRERLSKRGIVVEVVSITDFKFSESFTQAIEAKVTAEQLKLKADRDLQRIIVEKEQKIATAEAEAEALRLQKQELTPDLVRLRAIEKWDGIMPKVTGGAVPFIEVSGSVGGI